MPRAFKFIVPALLLFVAAPVLAHLSAQSPGDSELLRVRETVWRAWFANDVQTLHALVPPETIVFSGGEQMWKHQTEIFQSAREFDASGGKLIRLEFPHTEVQHFGNVAVIWSTYKLELEVSGNRSASTGRASEIFILRDGHWINPGWHTDPGK